MAVFTRVTASNRSGSTVHFAIEGADALERKLRTLPDKVQRKVVGASIRAGLRAIAKHIRAQADRSFKRAVGSRYSAKKGGMVGVNVGSGRRGDCSPRPPTPPYERFRIRRFCFNVPDAATQKRGSEGPTG